MRILIIEDDINIAENIKTGLLDEHFAVDVAHDGQDGYEMAEENPYDGIILDLMLPNLSGQEICAKLRTKKIQTPILMLTARDTLDDIVTGLDLGADDYMVKPFSFEELLARIRSLIRRSKGNTPVLQVDNLELNPNSHLVKRAGQEIRLTGKEYALLEYLMRHANQILSKEQILNHVWDYSYDSLSNIIEVLIRRLRNKIDRSFPGEKPLFQTIRGIGYRISE